MLTKNMFPSVEWDPFHYLCPIRIKPHIRRTSSRPRNQELMLDEWNTMERCQRHILFDNVLDCVVLNLCNSITSQISR